MISIRVLWPEAGANEQWLAIDEGATLGDALNLARSLPGWPFGDAAPAGCGVWGKARDAAWPLREGDRVEFYRPLAADPKDARRAKARQR